MSDELDQEDLSALSVLEDLAHTGGHEDTAPVDPPSVDEAVAVLRRLYFESLGLLAYDLPRAQPQAGTRATLLAHLIGDETQEISPLMIGAAHGSSAPEPSLSPAASSAGSPKEASAFSTAEPIRATEPTRATEPHRAARKPPRRSRWPAALATLFALATAGLGVWVAMLQSEVAYRDAQLRGLGARQLEVDRLAGELGVVKAELVGLEQRHAFVTAPATTIYALRPPAAGGLQPTARGHLFVAPDRRHWQLEVRGLKPEPEAQDYQLWFIVDGLPLSAGVFDARLGKPALLADNAMPAGTTAIAVSLERKGGTASPTSPILLIALSAVRL